MQIQKALSPQRAKTAGKAAAKIAAENGIKKHRKRYCNGERDGKTAAKKKKAAQTI